MFAAFARVRIFASMAFLAGCGFGMEPTWQADTGDSTVAGPRDGGRADTGIDQQDGGAGDAGAGDAGAGDAGAGDAGAGDAGSGDAGSGDAGSGDAGGTDSGNLDADGDGWTPNEGDCNDHDASLSPADSDGDGWSLCDGDCDDADGNTFPGAAEADSSTDCMTDADGDGWGADVTSSGVRSGDDCDDGRADIYPSATDQPWDGVDQDCSGSDAGTTLTAAGDSGLPIRDYTRTISYATLGHCSEIYDLTVAVNIDHTYIGDLTVDLIPPSGGAISLHDRSGGSTDDIIGSYSVSGGSLTSAESLSSLVGSSGTGEWALWVTDWVNLDTGTLNSWSLSVDCP